MAETRSVHPKPSEHSDEQRIQGLLERFSVDPTDTATFRTLEEHLFLAAAWSRLAGIYECRISAVSEDAKERADLLVRLAGVLEGPLGEPKAARRRYEELLRERPQHPEGLARLRRLHAGQGELMAALQIAEVEERLDLPPADRARMLAEAGQIWRELGETEEATRRLEEALRLDPGSDTALFGLAELSEDAGRLDEAVRLHERRLDALSGPARVHAMEHLAGLLPESQQQRIRTLLREVVREEPDRVAALERLIEIERSETAWDRIDDLQSALWRALPDDAACCRLALEAATLQLEDAGNVESALGWIERAVELEPESASTQKLRVRIYRRAGRVSGLIEALEALNQIEGPSCLRSAEIAVLHERSGRPDSAVTELDRALERDPNSREALVIMDRCLARLGRHDQRIDVMETLIRLAETPLDRANRAVDLGELFEEKLDDSARAEAAYRRALEIRTLHTLAGDRLKTLLRKLERFEELAEFLEEAARGEGVGAAQAAHWCELADLMLAREADPGHARSAYVRALECDPGCRSGLDGLRRVASVRGDDSSLIEACERELRVDLPVERVCELLRELIAASRRAGDLPRARDAAERWSDLEPEPGPFLELARTARELGDVACEGRALEALEGLLREQPGERAACLARLGDLALSQPDPDAIEEAAHWYRASLDLRGTREVRSKLIDVYRRSGQLRELIPALRAEVAACDEHEAPTLRLDLARTLAELGDLAGATLALLPAFDAEPAAEDVADLLESLLAEQDRVDALTEVIGRRLARERDPARRRTLAHRQAELLFDGLGRPQDAVAALREVADPSRESALELLYGRALDAGGSPPEIETWLAMRESHVDGPERVALLVRLSSLQERDGRIDEAIASLRRAERLLPDNQLDVVRRPLLSLLHTRGEPAAQLELLESLIRDSSDPLARTAFRIERARIFVDDLGQAGEALAELDALREQTPLRAAELRLLSALYGRAGAPEKRTWALEALIAATPDEGERRQIWLELADLRLDGSDEVRDEAEAEAVLRQIVESDSSHTRAFERLVTLYESSGRTGELAELLSSRLAVKEISRAEGAALTLRLARAHCSAGDAARAVGLLRAAREKGLGGSVLDESLLRALEQARDLEGRLTLCEEKARTESGAERTRWLRHWLEALEDIGGSREERLAVVGELLEERPGDTELLELRLPFLRALGRVGSLAADLEEILGEPAATSPGRRRILLRELLRLYEGPLDDASRALSLIMREQATDPELRERGARLAARLGDGEREVALLTPLVLEAVRPECVKLEHVRRLGLRLAEFGRVDDAEQLLWRSLDADPADREVLEALSGIARPGWAVAQRLRLLEPSFEAAAQAARIEIATQAFELADGDGDSATALVWVRRLRALAPLPTARLARWLALERTAGERTGLLAALAAARDATDNPQNLADLCAEEAAVHARSGQLELARRGYEEALESAPTPEIAWLAALERILDAQGQTLERIEALRTLARHSEFSPDERARYQQAKVELLISQPDLREEAVYELRELIAVDTSADRETRIGRINALLELYERLERDAQWCDLADTLLKETDEKNQPAIERALARRLTRPLAAKERALIVWQRILDRSAEDREALEALSGLLRAPGDEARLAEVLERLATSQGSLDSAAAWLEAAQIRWQSLRDSERAMADLESSLDLSPDVVETHRLRAEVCAHLGRRADEADSLRSLLELDPAGTHAGERWLRLAELLAGGETTGEETSAAAEHALELAEDRAGARSAVRRILERVHDWSRVAELLREEIDDSEPAARGDLLRRLARIEWDELREPAAASSTLAALARIDALDAEDQERWAEALGAEGRWAEAIAQRRQALELRGDQVSADEWLDLGRQTLERLDDPELTREACDRALLRDARAVEALRLRASLHSRLGHIADEVEDTIRLAELLPSVKEAADALVHAAKRVRADLGDDTRAWLLYRTALKRDASHVAALLGAGEIALERQEWGEAERMSAIASSLLLGSEDGERTASAARRAAEAALRQGREAEAFRYLELALGETPLGAETLDAMAVLAPRIGAHERARECLEARLGLSDLDPNERADRLVRLAQTYERLEDIGAAASSLEQVVLLRPDDEVSRARAVELLEWLGQTDRVLTQLEEWAQRSVPELRPGLTLRAARVEREAGRYTDARSRLEAVVEHEASPGIAWVELSELTLQEAGAEAAVEVSTRALDRLGEASHRASLLWVQARALLDMGRSAEAAARACASLEENPSNADAAQLIAGNLGQVGNWASAVTQLERALDAVEMVPPIEAEIWEAVGRAYAGPLENIERAERCYRRALEANSLRSSAREALADITAFDPGAHVESIRLHRELLEGFPARPRSWRAIARIAEHWGRDRARSTCERVLAAVSPEIPGGESEQVGAAAIRSDASRDAAIRVATDLLLELDEAGVLPEAPSDSPFGATPEPLGTLVRGIAGNAWALDDRMLRSLWTGEADGESSVFEDQSRGLLRRLRRTRREIEQGRIEQLNVEHWRSELLAQATASAVQAGKLELGDALLALLDVWPATAELDLRSGGDRGAAIQLCPPARALLLRTLDGAVAGLGL